MNLSSAFDKRVGILIKKDERKDEKEMKKKKISRGIAAILTLSFILASVTGCGNASQNETGSDNAITGEVKEDVKSEETVTEEKESHEPITLRWIMAGPGKQSDADKVWEAFNEKLHEYEGMENVNLEFEIIPGSEYAQKLMLKRTSGEQLDIISTYTASGGVQGLADEEAIIPLDDLVKNYGADILNEIPEWALNLCRANGELYALTNYQQMVDPMYGYVVRNEEYWDKEEAEKIFFASDILDEATLDYFEAYLDKLAENGELHMGIYPGTTWATRKGYESVSGAYVFRRSQDEIKVELNVQTEAFKLLVERIHEFYKKGYVREDVLSAKLSDDLGKENGYDLWYTSIEKDTEEKLEAKYGFDIIVNRPYENYYILNTANAGGNAISADCEHPEVAMQFLELMYTEKGKDLYRMLVYGLEGEHYTKVSEDRIEPIGYEGTQGTSDSPYGLYKWLCGNTANAFETVSQPEGWNDYVFNELNANAIPGRLAGFSLDTEKIDIAMKQVNAVIGEYAGQLTSGALPDWEKTYEEFMEKLKVAGSEAVIAEIQRQVDEFIENNK